MEQANNTPDGDIYDQEERCRRAIRTVARAIVMRLLVLALVIWAFAQAPGNGVLIGLLLLVAFITLGALPILIKELRRRRRELKALIAQE